MGLSFGLDWHWCSLIPTANQTKTLCTHVWQKLSELWWAVRFWANIGDHLWRMRNIYNFINIGSMSQRRPTSNYYTVWSYDCFNIPTQKIIFLNAHHNFCLGCFNFYFCKEMPFLVFCSWKLNTLEDQRDLKLDRVCAPTKSFQTQKSKTRN